MEKRTLHSVKTCYEMTNIPGTSLNVQAMPKVVDYQNDLELDLSRSMTFQIEQRISETSSTYTK